MCLLKQEICVAVLEKTRTMIDYIKKAMMNDEV